MINPHETDPDKNSLQSYLTRRGRNSLGKKGDSKTSVEVRRAGARSIGYSVLRWTGVAVAAIGVGTLGLRAIDNSSTMRHAENMEQHRLGVDLPGSVPFDPEAHVFNEATGQFEDKPPAENQDS